MFGVRRRKQRPIIIRGVSLNPGDVVVIEAPLHLGQEEASRMRCFAKRLFPDHEVIVLAGCHLGVLRAVGQ